MTSPKEPRPGVDRAVVERLASELDAYADGWIEARQWGGPTIPPRSPINEDSARAYAKALRAILAALPESGEAPPPTQDEGGEG